MPATLTRTLTDTFRTTNYVRRNMLLEILPTSAFVVYSINHNHLTRNFSNTFTTSASATYSINHTKLIRNFNDMLATSASVVYSINHIHLTRNFSDTFTTSTSLTDTITIHHATKMNESFPNIVTINSFGFRLTI